MNRVEKKPPRRVLSIKRGEQVLDDIITQEQLQKASDFQMTVWHAEKQCREYLKSLASRRELGATVERGPLRWDAENEMVRSVVRKSGAK